MQRFHVFGKWYFWTALFLGPMFLAAGLNWVGMTIEGRYLQVSVIDGCIFVIIGVYWCKLRDVYRGVIFPGIGHWLMYIRQVVGQSSLIAGLASSFITSRPALYTQIHLQVESPNNWQRWKANINNDFSKTNNQQVPLSCSVWHAPKYVHIAKIIPYFSTEFDKYICIYQLYFSTLFYICISEMYFWVYLQLYFSAVYFGRRAIYVQLWCRWKQGGWDNKERGIGSLWGDQHYGPEYNCGAGTAIYAPFQERGSE